MGLGCLALIGVHNENDMFDQLVTFLYTRDLDKSAAFYGETLGLDRKSTRLNSSHVVISYAVFCLKKKIKKL